MGWFDWFFVDLSRIGTDGLVFLVAGAVLALLWRRPWFFVLLLTADLAADGLSYLLRQWIDRERPPLEVLLHRVVQRDEVDRPRR